MLNRKRMRSESDDEKSTASSSEERTLKETLSPMNPMTKH